MARKRQIDPSIWTSEQFCSLKDLGARLLFIGMFSNADDEGRLKGSPAHLKMIIFPADEISVENVKKWRDELSTFALICVYKVADVEYIVLPTFPKYQFISRPYPSKIPEPFPNHSRTIPEVTNTNTIKDPYLKNTTSELLIDNGIDNSLNGSGMWKTEIIITGGELISMPILWVRTTELIKKRINASNYSTWITRMSLHGVNGNTVLITVQSAFHLENANKFSEIIKKSLYDVIGRQYTTRFVIDTDPDCVARYDEAVDVICSSYGITKDELLSSSRQQHLVNARRELCKGMMATGRFTVAELARRLGKHHTSVASLLAEKTDAP